MVNISTNLDMNGNSILNCNNTIIGSGQFSCDFIDGVHYFLNQWCIDGNVFNFNLYPRSGIIFSHSLDILVTVICQPILFQYESIHSTRQPILIPYVSSIYKNEFLVQAKGERFRFSFVILKTI